MHAACVILRQMIRAQGHMSGFDFDIYAPWLHAIDRFASYLAQIQPMRPGQKIKCSYLLRVQLT